MSRLKYRRSNKELNSDAWEIINTFPPHDYIYKRFERTHFQPHWVGAKTGCNLTFKRVKKAIREAERSQERGERLSSVEFEELGGYNVMDPSIPLLKQRAVEKYELGLRDHIQEIDTMADLIKRDPDAFPPAIKVGNIQTGGRTRDALSRLLWSQGYRFIDVDISKYGEGSSSATRRVKWLEGSPSAGALKEGELGSRGKRLRGWSIL